MRPWPDVLVLHTTGYGTKTSSVVGSPSGPGTGGREGLEEGSRSTHVSFPRSVSGVLRLTSAPPGAAGGGVARGLGVVGVETLSRLIHPINLDTLIIDPQSRLNRLRLYFTDCDASGAIRKSFVVLPTVGEPSGVFPPSRLRLSPSVSFEFRTHSVRPTTTSVTRGSPPYSNFIEPLQREDDFVSVGTRV